MENSLPWHLGTDLKHFKSRTSGHAIIMGRKTFESIGRPLPNRHNIILSRTHVADGDNVRWAPNPETALLIADQFSIINLRTQFFVIGGEEIYDLFHRYVNVVFLTDVFSGPINGDAKFDRDFDPREWWYRFEKEFPASDVDDHPFRISCLVRRKPVHRFASQKNFHESDQSFWTAWEQYEAMMAHAPAEPVVDRTQLDLLLK